MKAFYLTRPLTLRTSFQVREFPAARQIGAPFTTEIHIAAQNEFRLVSEALKKTYPQEPVSELIRVLSAESIARVPGMPPVLGLQAFADPTARIPGNYLIDQLKALKSAQPGRLYYRLLLINGFGTNLGDNLMGLTAFRHVLTLLREYLPHVSVDVLLGWYPDDRLARLFRNIEGIEFIRMQGLTFAELQNYQAIFDTGDLLSLPGYGRMPMVDWYLGWMGLDPKTIAPLDKRNAVAIPEPDHQFIFQHLPRAKGPRILVNPAASVPLRSMPESALIRLLNTLTRTWPHALIILMQPLPFEHPQIINFAGHITDVDRLAALTAQVDGLIGVDTFTAHLADATSTPAVTLYTTYLPGIYPYYPLNEALVLPNADEHPGWGRPKVKAQDWAGMAKDYETLWQEWDPGLIIAALDRAMKKKNQTPEIYPPRLLATRALPSLLLTRMMETGVYTLEIPFRQRETPLAQILGKAIAELSKQVLCAGDTLVFLGPGAGETVLGPAAIIGPHGRLITVEPRRVLHQMLCANLARAGILHAETHLAMPEGMGLACRKIDGLELMDESSSLSLSNSEQPEPVICWPFDILEIRACRFMVIRSPLARLEILAGTRATLKRLRPMVLIGIVSLQKDGKAFEDFFKALDYRIRTMAVGDSTMPEKIASYGILVAEPISLCLKSSSNP